MLTEDTFMPAIVDLAPDDILSAFERHYHRKISALSTGKEWPDIHSPMDKM